MSQWENVVPYNHTCVCGISQARRIYLFTSNPDSSRQRIDTDGSTFTSHNGTTRRSRVEQISSGLMDMRKKWTKVYEERIRERDALIASLKTLALSDCKTKEGSQENGTTNTKTVLDLVQRLQKDKDQLLIKLMETETREENLQSVNDRLTHLNDLHNVANDEGVTSEMPIASWCSTDTEKELENLKKQQAQADQHIQRLREDNKRLLTLLKVNRGQGSSMEVDHKTLQSDSPEGKREAGLVYRTLQSDSPEDKREAGLVYRTLQSDSPEDKREAGLVHQNGDTIPNKNNNNTNNNNNSSSNNNNNNNDYDDNNRTSMPVEPIADDKDDNHGNEADDARRISFLESQIVSLKAQLEEGRQDLVEMEEKIRERQREEEGGIKRQQELENQLTETRGILDVLKTTVLSLYRDFVQVKHSYLSLKDTVSNWPSKFQQWTSHYHQQIHHALQSMTSQHQKLTRKYRLEMKRRKALHNQLVELKGNIRVFCRIRPVIKEEGDTDTAVTFDPEDDDVVKITNRGRDQEFNFDRVFTMSSVQEQVFDEVSPLVRSVLDGFNVCIFAYGQTGSGKTYTMEGPTCDPGINQRALHLLFEESRGTDWHYDITASVMEIYNETIRDLLNSDPSLKLEVKLKAEGGLHVPGLMGVPVVSLEEINRVFETGRSHRATASTNMNDLSSRSHCLLCIEVRGHNSSTGSSTFGRLNLVDLAGSERLAKSQADGARLKEAQSINKSLACLGDVIYALRSKQGHVPYRNSKLTYLLQDSLGGDSKTLMIIQASPSASHVDETVCSLAFGQRVRSVEIGPANKHSSNGHKSSSTPSRPGSLNLSRTLSSPPPSSLTSPRSPRSPRFNKTNSFPSTSSSSSTPSSSNRPKHSFSNNPVKSLSLSSRSSSSNSSTMSLS